MVVFTCNHCGESLQKPRVEKHYTFVCRAVKNLTCIDCLKDFREEEYAAHTKCMTEEERYSVKGTFKNGDVKKGELKQELWIDMINAIIKQEINSRPQIRNLLNMISQHTNVPRKKAKFINFVKSSSGGRVNMNEVEEVWNIIESYKQAQEKLKQNHANVSENGHDKEDSSNAMNGIDKTEPVDTDNSNSQKEKKKKKKSKDVENEAVPNLSIDENSSVQTNNTKLNGIEENHENSEANIAKSHKKSKKKKQVIENGTQSNLENEDTVIPNSTESSLSKSKKKKHKADSNVQNGENHSLANHQNEIDKSNAIEQNGIKEKSKKNKSKSDGEENVIADNPSENAEESHNTEDNLKKSKRKSKSKQIHDIEQANNGALLGENNEDFSKSIEQSELEKKCKKKKLEVSENLEDQSPKKAKLDDTQHMEVDINSVQKEFNFEEKIINTVTSKGSIATEKLEKKVLAAYMKHFGLTEKSPKIIKKFNKKLKKLDTIEIVDNNVTLKS